MPEPTTAAPATTEATVADAPIETPEVTQPVGNEPPAEGAVEKAVGGALDKVKGIFGK